MAVFGRAISKKIARTHTTVRAPLRAMTLIAEKTISTVFNHHRVMARKDTATENSCFISDNTHSRQITNIENRVKRTVKYHNMNTFNEQAFDLTYIRQTSTNTQ